jgi:hypothetical protein
LADGDKGAITLPEIACFPLAAGLLVWQAAQLGMSVLWPTCLLKKAFPRSADGAKPGSAALAAVDQAAIWPAGVSAARAVLIAQTCTANANAKPKGHWRRVADKVRREW